MSLKGGKLLCLNENAQVKKILKPKGKSFKVGEYFSCDYIYEDGKSKSGIYFEIVADAFGRITIINHIKENPITVNGKTIQNKANLLDGNSIKVLDKNFIWQFSIPTVKDADKKTPENIKYINKPAPYSEERFDKQYINLKRLTVHSFVEWIRPKSLEITEEASHITLDEKSVLSNTLSNKTNNVMQTVEQQNEELSPITVTNHGARLSSEKILDISNRENNIPENEKLSKCRVSEILCISCTSNTKFNTTLNSIYSTPKSILTEHNSIDNENSQNLINFSTPEPNTSMHFIDLITPIKHHYQTPHRKPPTTLLKSALKNSARSLLKSRNKSATKNDILNKNAEKIKLRCRETFKDLNKDTMTPSSLLSKSSKTINENQVEDHSKNVEILLNSTVESLSVIDLDLESSVNVEDSIIEISNDSSSPIDSSPQVKRITNSNNTPSKNEKLQTPNKSTVIKAGISNTQKKLPKPQPPSSSSLSKTVAIPKTALIKKLPSPKIRNNKLNVSSITKTVNSSFRCPSSMKTNAGKAILKNTSLLISKASASVNLKRNSSIPLRRSQSESKAIVTTNSSTTDKKTISLKRLQEKSSQSVGRRRLDYAANTSKIATTVKNSSIIKNPINNKKLNQSLQNHKTPRISKVPTFKLSKSVIEKTLEKPIEKNNLSKTLTSSTSIRSNKKILGKQYTSVSKENKSVSQNLNEINNIIIDKEKIINKEEKLENITEIQKDNSKQVNKISNSLQKFNDNENIMKSSFIEDEKIQEKLNKTFEIDQIEVNESLNKTFDLGNESYSHLKEVCHQKIVSNEMEIVNEDKKIVMLSKPKIVEINKINEISITTTKEPSLMEEKQQKNEQQQCYEQEEQQQLQEEEEQNTDTERRDIHSPIVQYKYEDDINDDIFKTPSAKMLMMLGTPKSANVIEKINIDNEVTQKLYDIQEEIEKYTETDDILIASSKFHQNIDNENEDIQEIESINDEKEITIDSLNINENIENDPLNFQTIFDKLAGKPIIKKCYSNKSSFNQSKYSISSNTTSSSLFINETLNDTQQENFPSTDVEQWIDNINKCKTNNESIVQEIPANMSGIVAFDETNQSHFTEHLIFSESDEETDEENQQQKQSITSETSINETSLEMNKISVKSSHSEIVEYNDSSIFQEDDDDYDKTLIEKLGNDKSILLHSRARSFSPQRENSLLSDTSKQNIYHDYVLEDLSKSDKSEDVHNESAFEKFEELPQFKRNRGHSMSQSLKATGKNENNKTTRRTMYSKPEDSSFDLSIARTQFEKEEAFRNFNLMPKFRITRVKSTDHITSKKVTHASRKTLYHKPLDSSFDINVAKTEYELKKAFKNFDSEKTVQARGKSAERDLQKNQRGISRKTLYHEPLDSSFDINVAKTQYEIKEAFKNFDSEMTVQARGKSAERDLQKNERGVSRKTLYHEPLDSSFDINVAKTQYEIKEAFKNFDSEMTVQARGKSAERDLQKNERGVSRKTLYHNPIDSSFDINVAKTKYEIKEAFKNFDSEMTVQARGKSAERDLQKNQRGISRKTLYHEPLDSSFDINVAKTQYEIKEAFKNFDSEMTVQARGKSAERDLQKNERGVSRKTLYHEPLDSSFDINVAKTEYEIKEAFKNFDSEMTVQARGKSAERDLQKNERGVSRKTLYHEPLDSSFDINVAKTEYEMKEAFKNFDSEMTVQARGKSAERDLQKNERGVSRKTLYHEPLDSSFDINVAKTEYEMKEAFKNFDSEKTVQARGKSAERDLQKNKRGISRKTLYHEPLDSSFDINVAKTEYEIKEAFKNFDSEKTVQARGKSAERDLQKNERGISRKTLYHEPLDSSFDINVAKTQYEMKEAFKNFDSEKTVQARGKSAERDLQKNERGISRKTLYHEPLDSSFDINVAKTQYEIKEAFKNFSCKPKIHSKKTKSMNEIFQNEISPSLILNKTVHQKPCLDSSFDLLKEKEKYNLKIVSTNQECVENDEIQKNVPVKSEQKCQLEEIVTISNEDSFEKKEIENNDSLIGINKIDDILKTKSQSTPVTATHDLITPLKKSDKYVFLTPVTTAKRTRQTRKKEIASTVISTTPSENNVNDESSIMNYSSFLTPLRRSQRTTKGKKPAWLQENDNSITYPLNSSVVASEKTTRRGRGGNRNLKNITKLSDKSEKAEPVEKSEVTSEINTNKEEKLITETKPMKGRGQKKENLKNKIEADEEEKKNNGNLTKNESTTNKSGLKTSKKSQENENENTVKTRGRKCKNVKLEVKEEVNTLVCPVKLEIKKELSFELNDTENEALKETTLQKEENKKLKRNTRKRKNLEMEKTEILENKIHTNEENDDAIKRKFEITVTSEEATVTRRTTRRNKKKEFLNEKEQNLKIENQIKPVKEINGEVKNLPENIQNELIEKNDDCLLNKQETNKKQRATRKKFDKKENLILKENTISEKEQDPSKSNEEEPKVNEENFLSKKETIKSNRTTRKNQIHNVHENEANCKSENKDNEVEEQKENFKKKRPQRGKNVEKEDNINKIENVAMESLKEDISERLSGKTEKNENKDSSEKVKEVCEEKIENHRKVKNENKPVDMKPRRGGRKRKNENDSEIAAKVLENQNDIVESNSSEESPSKLMKIKEKEKSENAKQRKGRKRKSESEDEKLQKSFSEKMSEKQKKTTENDSKTTGKVSENQNNIVESNSSEESPSKLMKIKEKEEKNDTANPRKLRKRRKENEDEKLQESSFEKQKKTEEKDKSLEENKTEQIDENNQEMLKTGRKGRLRGKIDNKVKNDISIQPVTETKRVTRRRK